MRREFMGFRLCAGWRASISRLFAALVLGLLVAAACAPPAAQPQASRPEGAAVSATAAPMPTATPKVESIVIGIPSITINTIPLVIGAEKGFFREQFLEAEVTIMPSTTAVAGLSAGSVDYASSLGTLSAAIAGGLPAKAVMTFYKSADYTLISQPEIQTAADLKGKTVAVANLSGAPFMYGVAGLRKLGLDYRADVNLLATGSQPNSLAALSSGQIAAAVLTTPSSLIAQRDGYRELIFLGDLVEVPATGLGASDAKIRENPDQIKRAIRAGLKIVAFMRDNRKETVDSLAKNVGVEQQLAELAYDQLLRQLTKDGSISAQAWEFQIRTVKEEQKIDRDIPVAEMYDPRLLREVQREMGVAP